MNILAADIGTHTGFACIIGGQRFSGVWDSSRTRRESPGMVFVHFRAHLMRFLREQQAQWNLAVTEQGHQRGSATESLLGLAGIFGEVMCSQCPECQFTTVQSGELKKFTTGGGKASKADMIAAANERWGYLYPSGDTDSDDEADARALLEYAITNYDGGTDATT